MSWLDQAACAGRYDEFFEHVWPDGADLDGRPPRRAQLKHARYLCKSCPVRMQCAAWIYEVENGLPASERWGVVAGMTPSERAKIHSVDQSQET